MIAIPRTVNLGSIFDYQLAPCLIKESTGGFMSKKVLNTKKIYYGFPVYLIGYKDEQYGYNFTTHSSSYSLADMVVIGMHQFGNAAKQIQKYHCFTINLPDKSLMKEIEIGGKNSQKDKFKLAGALKYTVSSLVDAPIIENCMLTLECEVIKSYEYKSYTHFMAQIKGRLVEAALMDGEVIDRKSLNPVLYMGDSHKRSYRYLTDEIDDYGDFT